MNVILKHHDEYTLHIVDGDTVVGRIVYDNLLPERLFSHIKTDAELKQLESIEEPRKALHLNYITVYKEFEGKGYFKEAMKLFRLFTKELGFKKITLISEYRLTPMYEKLGYVVLFSLPSVNSDVCFIHTPI